MGRLCFKDKIGPYRIGFIGLADVSVSQKNKKKFLRFLLSLRSSLAIHLKQKMDPTGASLSSTGIYRVTKKFTE